MRILRPGLPILFVAFSLFSQLPVDGAKPDVPLDRLFDEYGRIRWEDEQARLDNFAIQLMNEPDAIGYIFVINGPEVCPGEAQARATRAKRYIVEHRQVPWNRVIWREDGYGDEFRTVLQPAPRDAKFPYPFFGLAKPPSQVHILKNCRMTIAKIKGSKW